MFRTTSIRRGSGALAALVAAGALAVPAHGETLSDAYPSPQAVAANAEFLAQVPAPPGGAGVVCVIDTGVTPLPDTASQIVERIAIDGGTPDDIDHVPGNPLSGHGSFVVSTIASQIDGHGGAGIWPAAKIISVRVFSRPDAGATAGDYIAAISQCSRASRNVRVINVSLGDLDATSYELSKLEDRITNAHAVSGINVVASAGNNGSTSAVDYPARFTAALAVGSTDADGAFCHFSNRGDGLDISTMGCNIRATAFNGTTGSFAGTSYSGPVVSGILAALRSYRPELTAADAARVLVETADRTSAGPVANAGAAFRAAQLDHLIDAYKPPAPSIYAGGGARNVTVDDDRPTKPRLLAAAFKRGVMRLRVARPRRDSQALFRVNGRSYLRRSGVLVVRARAWRSVSVSIEDKWGARSKPLTVRRPGWR
jgi:subtilisin family serine protease